MQYSVIHTDVPTFLSIDPTDIFGILFFVSKHEVNIDLDITLNTFLTILIMAQCAKLSETKTQKYVAYLFFCTNSDSPQDTLFKQFLKDL